jgi:hypothetical protein
LEGEEHSHPVGIGQCLGDGHEFAHKSYFVKRRNKYAGQLSRGQGIFWREFSAGKARPESPDEANVFLLLL